MVGGVGGGGGYPPAGVSTPGRGDSGTGNAAGLLEYILCCCQKLLTKVGLCKD